MTGMEAETLAKENDDTKKGEDSIPKPTDAATAASNGEELMEDMNEETETMEENSKQRKSDALDDSEGERKGAEARKYEQINATREKLKKEFQEEKDEILASRAP